MELDTKSPVSDDERRLAESKKLTLEPVHADVGPDDLPDAEIAARHINEPAIANLENDTEQTAAVVQPSKGLLDSRSQATASGRIITIAAIVTTAAVLFGVVLFFV